MCSAYLATDLFSPEQANGQAQQPYHCPLHKEAEILCLDTEVVEMVSNSLPHAAYTVSENKRDKGYLRWSGYCAEVSQAFHGSWNPKQMV